MRNGANIAGRWVRVWQVAYGAAIVVALIVVALDMLYWRAG